MSLATYSDLKTSIADWLNRDDLTSVIPDFVTLAEAKLNRRLSLYQMERRFSFTTTESTGYFPLPTRFKQMKVLRYNGDRIDYIPSYDLDKSGEYDGVPKFYTIEHNQIRILPKVENGKTVEIVCYQKPEALSDTNTTNYWLTDCEDVLLNGCLYFAYTYLKDDNAKMFHGSLFEDGILELESSNTDRWGGKLVMKNG